MNNEPRPFGDQTNEPGSGDQSYGRHVVSSLGAARRAPTSRWRPGVAGTTGDGIRFVVYQGHVRAGGNQAWRINNPGYITMGPFARAYGAIGNDGQYAIFPNESLGKRALADLLRTREYSALAVYEVLSRHVPTL